MNWRTRFHPSSAFENSAGPTAFFQIAHQRSHHFPQSPAGGQLVQRIQVEEMAKVAPLHLRAGELVENEVACHAIRIVVSTLRSAIRFMLPVSSIGIIPAAFAKEYGKAQAR
jgi:hypothetical protein